MKFFGEKMTNFMQYYNERPLGFFKYQKFKGEFTSVYWNRKNFRDWNRRKVPIHDFPNRSPTNSSSHKILKNEKFISKT